MRVQGIALDAGGTMTDSILIDEKGNVTTGKSLSSLEHPEESVASSISDAASYINISLPDACGTADSVIYAGTAVLNTLLTGTGKKLGLITSKGLQDYLLMERGMTWLGMTYSERIHTVTHTHREPVIPKERIRTVTGRIDSLGQEVIPLYEEEVKQAVQELLAYDIEGLVVMYPFSHLNPTHENQTFAIVRATLKEAGRQADVILSHQVAATLREYSRLYAAVLQAYAAEPVREQCLQIEAKVREQGYAHPLYTLLAYGGMVDVRYPRLYETFTSGPVGGVLGAHFLSRFLKEKNIICADMGGTSFDVAIIRDGMLPIHREPTIFRWRVNLPIIQTESIGAGTGTEVNFDAEARRFALGPKSAGADVGMCFRHDKPTVADCNVALGYLNPDYFLGGKIKLNKEKALKACEALAMHLDADVYETAYGILETLNKQMRNHIEASLLIRGYTPPDYVLAAYGGAGPLHLWGYADGIPLKGIVTFPFAACFSAFGILTADYFHRYHKGILASVPPSSDPSSRTMRAYAAFQLNSAWTELRERALNELQSHGFSKEKIKFQHLAYVRYNGQLDDFETVSPVSEISDPKDLDKLTVEFERIYETKYPKGAKYPEAGYLIMEVAVCAYMETVKPKIKKYKLSAKKRPPTEAYKGERRVYYKGKWLKFSCWEMDHLLAGNRISGPALIEHPTTTLVISPAVQARFDEYRFIRLENR